MKTIRKSAMLGLLLSATFALAAVQGNFDRSLKVTGAVDMEVATGSGHINVKTGPAGAVTVHAHVQISEGWFSGGDDAQARLQRIIANPPIEQNGNTIRIGHMEDSDLRRNVSISYDVVVPAETRVSAKTGSGDVEVDGVKGPLEASSGSGTLKASSIGAQVRATTGSGDISLQGVNGSVEATTGSGSITATRVAGGFDGGTGSGDIRIEQTAPGNVKVSTGSGSIDVAGVKGGLNVGTGSGDIKVQGEPTAGWRVESGSGTVDLKLPSEAAFDLYARSSSGRIDVEHPLTTQGSIGNHEVRGKVRGGGYLVEVRTSSGEITVH